MRVKQFLQVKEKKKLFLLKKNQLYKYRYTKNDYHYANCFLH
jgi:hypothetical protein